eukprot:1480926-Pyramimonas_sp.AAC.1
MEDLPVCPGAAVRTSTGSHVAPVGHGASTGQISLVGFPRAPERGAAQHARQHWRTNNTHPYP